MNRAEPVLSMANCQEQEFSCPPISPGSALAGCEVCGTSNRTLMFVKKGYRLVQCSGCGLVYVENPPSKEDVSKLYNHGAYHSELADDNAPSSRWHAKKAARHLRFLSRYRKAGRLLDVGCSAGFFLRQARDEGWEVYGVECNARSAQVARQIHGLNVSSALEELDFPNEFFDAVTFWDVIEHLPAPLSSVRSLARLIKPGGVVALETPNIDGLFPQLSYRVAKLLNHWPHPTPPAHLFQFSKKTMRLLLQEAGFRVLATRSGRISLRYSFGMESLKRAAYSVAFAPTVLMGPLVGAGDHVTIAAMKMPLALLQVSTAA